jgi:hypothetical protein
MSRAAWLESHRAEGSWPCGVVRYEDDGQAAEAADPWARGSQPRKGELPVSAVLLPDEVAFLAEPPAASGLDEMLEVGRIPRAAIDHVDVMDELGAHVPEPSNEDFEPTVHRELVLRWTNEGAPDEERFVFRSTWPAWAAGRRLRLAKLP